MIAATTRPDLSSAEHVEVLARAEIFYC